MSVSYSLLEDTLNQYYKSETSATEPFTIAAIKKILIDEVNNTSTKIGLQPLFELCSAFAKDTLNGSWWFELYDRMGSLSVDILCKLDQASLMTPDIFDIFIDENNKINDSLSLYDVVYNFKNNGQLDDPMRSYLKQNAKNVTLINALQTVSLHKVDAKMINTLETHGHPETAAKAINSLLSDDIYDHAVWELIKNSNHLLELTSIIKDLAPLGLASNENIKLIVNSQSENVDLVEVAELTNLLRRLNRPLLSQQTFEWALKHCEAASILIAMGSENLLNEPNFTFIKNNYSFFIHHRVQAVFAEIPFGSLEQRHLNHLATIIQNATDTTTAATAIADYLQVLIQPIQEEGLASLQPENFNPEQSTHTASVHESVTASVIKLTERYGTQLDQLTLEKVMSDIEKWLYSPNTQYDCDIKFMSTSPLGTIITDLINPSYVITPDGVYYVSYVNEPVTSENLLAYTELQHIIDGNDSRSAEDITGDLWLSLSGKQEPFDSKCEPLNEKQKIINDKTGHIPLYNHILPAREFFSKVVGFGYYFKDPGSRVTTKKFMAFCWLAIEDETLRSGVWQDAADRFVSGLYEAQRAYNISSKHIDTGGRNRPGCASGAFNKLAEKLWGTHPDVELIYITKETATMKLQSTIQELTYNYVSELAQLIKNPEDKEKLMILLTEIMDGDLEKIWPDIMSRIEDQIFDDYRRVFPNDEAWSDFIEAGKNIDLNNKIFSKLETNIKTNFGIASSLINSSNGFLSTPAVRQESSATSQEDEELNDIPTCG